MLTCERQSVYYFIPFENTQEIRHLKELGVNGMILLQFILRKEDKRDWTGLNCVWIWINGGIFILSPCMFVTFTIYYQLMHN